MSTKAKPKGNASTEELKKRKRVNLEEASFVDEDSASGEDDLGAGLALHMQSEDEGSEEDPDFVVSDAEGDTGSEEEFPELETGSSEEDGGTTDGNESPSDLGHSSEEESQEDKVKERLTSTLPGVYPGPRTVISNITGYPKRMYPEIEPDYDSDSSTEDAPNRTGNVPMHWYDDLPHVGYDINGKRVLRPAKGDELDKFLATVDDPSSWTAGYDHALQAESQLTSEELDIIRRLQASEVPDESYDPYEPTVEWFTGKGKEEVMPLSGRLEPKRRWQPSKWEKQKVMKIVRAIRQGRIVPNKPKTTQPQFYSIWATPANDRPPPLTAPKVRLPTNSESYNPPAEYLPTEDEKKKWEETEKEDRAQNYLPKKYSALRLVPAYDQFIQERFSRLLDLYLAPRIQRKRLNIDPESLLPSLPSPQSLKPFPVFQALKMRKVGTSRIRCLAVSPDGVWTVAGDEAGVVRIWETAVGREAGSWNLGSRIGSVEWCPRTDISYFMVGTEDAIRAFMPPYLPPAIFAATLAVLNPTNPPQSLPTASSVIWTNGKDRNPTSNAPVLVLSLPPSAGLPRQITFHRRGDYFATVLSGEGQNGLWIHQITKRHSQNPFKKIKGTVQRVLFHPTKPQFFVATQKYVRMYDLAAQLLIKTLQPGIRWISSMDIHSSGDHLIVGGYDKKLCWFDLDLSDKPYKVLRYHSRAIRSLTFSPTYPLFASSSDDGTIQIFHGRVYSDLLTDPLIVPLKVLKGHEVKEGLGVLEIKWVSGLGNCWLVSGGADGNVTVWAN